MRVRIIFNVEFTPVLVPANLSGDRPPPQPDTVIQGRVALTADVSRGDPSKDQWRVESLELLSGKSYGRPPERRCPRRRGPERNSTGPQSQPDSGPSSRWPSFSFLVRR